MSLVFGSVTGGNLASLSLSSSTSSSPLSPLTTFSSPASASASVSTTTPPADCDLSSSSTALTSVNTILKCLDINELNLTGLGRLETIDISECATNIEACKTLLESELQQHPNSIFAQIVTKLTTTPETTCPCITNAASSLNNCLPIFGHLTSYCSMIETTSTNSHVTSCSDTLQTICPAHSNFQETFTCLEAHISELEGKCSIPLNAMMANMYSDCQQDITDLCTSEYVISCLQDNYQSLSENCQAEFANYLHGDYPCLDESKLLCPDAIDPDEFFQCLSGYLDPNHKKLSKKCQTIVAGYQSCSNEQENNKPDEGKPNDGPAPPNGEGPGGEGHSSPGNNGDAEPKRGPGAPPNNGGSGSGSSGSSGGDDNGNGDGNGDGDNSNNKNDPKPTPNDKAAPQSQSPQEQSESQSQRKLQKSKPSPKPKPGPANEKPCWARGNPDGTIDSNVPIQEGSDLLDHSDLSNQSNDSSTSTTTSIAIIAACLGIIMSLIVALIYTRQQGSDSDDMPTVKGYWRAPSIQASLYDDSTHSEGAVVFGDGVEMEKVSNSFGTPIKVNSNGFRPNSPSEVRI